MKKGFLSIVALALCAVISMLSLSIAVTAEETQNSDTKSSDIIFEPTVGEAGVSRSGDIPYSSYHELPKQNGNK